jgi:hypothetical protein
MSEKEKVEKSRREWIDMKQKEFNADRQKELMNLRIVFISGILIILLAALAVTVMYGLFIVPIKADAKCSVRDWVVVENVSVGGVGSLMVGDLSDKGRQLVPIGVDCSLHVEAPWVKLMGMLNGWD